MGKESHALLPLGTRERSGMAASATGLPLTSVVLAVRNEEEHIGRILDQIFKQDYPSHLLEVIIVDGQSDDRTAEIGSSYSYSGKKPILLRLTERGRSQGLNRGILAAKGDVIVRIDARTSISSDYVSRCVETLARTGADNVGGVQRPLARSHRQEAIGIAMSHPFGVGNAQFRLGKKSGFVDSVYLGCFRREIFNKVGLFDERAAVISEDSDINQRIREAGGKVYLNKDIVAYYYPRERFLDFWKLYFRYGGARAGNLLKHRKLTSWRQAVPPVFLATVALSPVLALIDGRFLYLAVATPAVYVVANLSVSVALAAKEKKPWLAPLASCAFACMHFGWALGFWRRLLVPEKAGRYWGN
ncbi:MAG: glycosyltransferase family 2 protein [Betaproteobacteria bacterium]|nr:MAG: glycosyltransferase family 2 protein [Betaproteobacteria bacterium]